MSILQTTELKKYYGTKPNITKALDGVNLSVEQGEFCSDCWNLRQRQIHSAEHDRRAGCAYLRQGHCGWARPLYIER